MHTDLDIKRCETSSISIAAPPADVFEFVAEPTNLPRWAPAFASSIRPDGERWIVSSSTGEAPIVVAADKTARTVDILADADRTRGAFARILPNGGGSEMLFSLLFGTEASADEVAAQMLTVRDELEAVRRFVERRRSD
jgi:hypothetical protein